METKNKKYTASKYGNLDETMKAVRKYNEENSYFRKVAKAVAEYRRTYKNTDKNTEELTPLPESLVKKYNIKVPEEYKSKQLEPKSDFQRQVDNVRARQNAQFVEGTGTRERTGFEKALYYPDLFIDSAFNALGSSFQYGSAATAWAAEKLFSGFGLAPNKASEFFKQGKEYWLNYETPAEKRIKQRKSAFTRSDLEKNWVEPLVENAGALAPDIAIATLSGGGSAGAKLGAKGAIEFGAKQAAVEASLAKPGQRAISYIKAIKPEEVMFGLSAAGRSAKEAYRESGNADKAIAYGAASGVLEMATEKLFGGIAGTDIGESVIKWGSKNKTLNKIFTNSAVEKGLDIAGEGVEEMISTAVDPYLRRATVDPNAPSATVEEYGVSAAQGMLLAGVMGVATYPVKKANIRSTAKLVNEAFETLGTVMPEESVPKPLNVNFATEKQVIARQEELKTFAGKYEKKVADFFESVQKAQDGTSFDTTLGKGQNVQQASSNAKKAPSGTGQTAKTFEWGSRLLENGKKAFEANFKSGSDLDSYSASFARWYDMGLNNVPFEKVKSAMKNSVFGDVLSSDQSFAAYTSGVNDARASLEKEKRAVEFVKYYKNDAGIVDNEFARGLSGKDIKAIDSLAKAVGTQVVFTDSIDKGRVNGFIENGKIYIARDAENAYSVVAGHEVTHRMQELAPEEYRSFRNFVVSKNSEAVSMYGSRLAEKGYYLTEEQIMDEIAADYASQILRSPENIQNFISDAENGKFDKSKTAKENMNIAQRFYQALKEFIERVKAVFKGDKKAQDTQSRKFFGQDMAELEKARELLGNSFTAAQERVKQMNKRSIDRNYEGKYAHSGIKLSQKFEDYPYNMQKVLEEYLESADSRIYNFAEDHKKGEFKRLSLDSLKNKIIMDIKEKTGLNAENYIFAINSNAIEHIKKRHGENGLSDNTMANVEDIARLLYVAQNYDNIDVLKMNNGEQVYSKEFRNKDNTPSVMMKCSKKINGTYYTVIAVPDSNYKKVWIVSAYINKNGVTQVPNDEISSLGFTPESELASPPTNYNISQNNNSVNTQYMQNGQDNAQKDFGDFAAAQERVNGVSKGEAINSEAGKKKLSIKQSFYSDYDNWAKNGYKGIRTINVGRTSDVLKSIGVKDTKIMWDTSKIIKIKNKHNMSDMILKQVPDIIENPVVVMQSLQSQSRLTLVGEVYDLNNKAVLAVIELEPLNKKGEIILNEIKIASAYGKDNLQSFINRSKILYVDSNKKRTNNWLTQNGLQLPVGQTNYWYNNNISQNNNSVNTQYMQNGQDNAQKNSVKGVDNILREDIEKIQSIPKKSVNDFTSDDIKKTEKFARKYFKEMGTKSPFFRAWFGDWRANDDTRVKVADKKGAERGVTRNADTGWDINVSGKVFNETKSHNQNYNVKARPYLEYINSIVENAVLLDSYTIPNTKKKSNNSAMMHSFYAIADIGNGRELVKLYVEELNDVNSDGTIKRAYQLQNIENQQLNDRVQGNTLAPSASTANIHTVSQLFNLVKTFDKNFSPKEASKVVNADGTPKVVHHGTNSDFTIFKSDDGTYWFSETYDYAEAMAEERGGNNVMEMYLDMKNPYTAVLSETQFAEPRYEKPIIKKAHAKGCDGVILKCDTTSEYAADTFYIVFNPNQIKSATDNIGTFDSANDDVRYSVKGTDDILKQNEALQKYTDKLKKLLYRLQRGDYSYFVSKNISKAAEDILSETNSAYSKKKLTDALEGLSEDTQAIIKGAMTFEQFRGKVNELARDVLEEGLKNDSIEYADTKALRNYLRTTAISLSEAERSNLGEEYEQIRRETFGRLRLSKNGTDIGTVYRELSLLYPEFFNDETETNASAQLRRIREVIAHLKSLNENPYDGYMNEASEWLSNVMIDRIYSEGFRSGRNGAKVIFDTKELRKNAIYTLEDIMKTERNWRAREYGKMKRAFDEKTKKLFEKKEREIAGSKAEYAEKKERFFKNKEKAENIKTIKLYTERLTVRLIRSTERASVPEYLRKPVAGFLECINYESPKMKEKTMERLSELRQLYTTIQNREVEAELVIDPDLLDNITEIVDEVKALNTKNTSLYDLSYETVETLKRTVIAIDASISSYNQIIVNGREERLDTVAEKVYDDLIKRDAHTVSKIGAIRNTGEFLNVDMLNPWDFFHQMGPTMEGLYNDLREGQNKQIRRNNESELYMEKLMEDCGVKAKEVSGKTAKVYTFKLADGESISLNKSQIMSLYCLSRQAASLRHILNGGIKPSKRKSGLIADVDRKKRIETKQIEELNPVDVTAADIEKIVNTLSEKEKEFAKGVSKFFTTKCAEWGNEVSLELYGYKKFTAGNYFPIVSDKMYVAKDFKAADAASPKIKNAGITKNRLLLAENPIMVEDIFDVYTRHTSTMANYDAYVIPLFNLERVYNSKGLSRDLSAADINEQTLNEHYPKGLAKGKSVRAAIKTRLGGAADKYFTRFMADVNMGSKFEGGSKIANALTRTYKAAAVNFNARVVIQQPISWVRANALIDFKYMTEGLRRKVDSEIMYEYSPIARWKDWGFFDMDTGKNMKDIITKKKQLSDAGMFFAGFADHVTWKKLWGAVEAEIADKRPDLAEGSVKFYQECGKRFDEIIDRTQVVDSTFHRSQALRSKDGLMKIATSFMSEPTKTYNLLRTAVEDYKLDPTKKGKKMLMRTVKVAIINSILNAIAMGAFDTLKGDEDDEGFYERIFNKKTGREIPEYESKAENIKRRFFWNYVDNQIGDWAGMIPFFKDVYSIVQGNDVNRMDMAPVGDLVDALKILSSDKYTGTYKTANLFAICADCLGIGVKKLKKSVYDVFIKHIIASLNNQALEYRLMKQFYTIDGNFGKYTSLLFDAWRNGNKDQYDEIIGDMIDSGQSPKDIQNSLGRMFREYKKTEEFKNSEGFDVPWDNYVENNDEKEEKFDLSMLNKEQYKVYNDKSVELENSVVDEVEEMGSYFADEKTHKKAISAAYKYTEETAREEAYPQYETDVSWVETVQKAARERVMNEAELIKYKTKYDLNSIAIDKLIAAVKYGVDAQDYLEFKEYAADLHGKNKKAKIQKYLNSQNLSQKEKNYLYYKVMNYKR